jgi:hypothetical protein
MANSPFVAASTDQLRCADRWLLSCYQRTPGNTESRTPWRNLGPPIQLNPHAFVVDRAHSPHFKTADAASVGSSSGLVRRSLRPPRRGLPPFSSGPHRQHPTVYYNSARTADLPQFPACGGIDLSTRGVSRRECICSVCLVYVRSLCCFCTQFHSRV